jgi:hypothetical protein
MASDDSQASKLTEKMRDLITEEEPKDNMIKPGDIISAPVLKRDSEKTESAADEAETKYIQTATAEEQKLAAQRTRRAKRKESGSIEGRSVSKLHAELQKHSHARRKTDLAIKDVEKQLKSLLLAHHSAIRDLRKDIARLRKSIPYAKSKKTVNKTGKKKTVKKKPSRKSNIRKF